METKWNFLYHVMEILTRKKFWEVYTEVEANNWQSTYEVCKALRREFTEHLYDCGRYTPANGVNFDGSPSDFPFTPYETAEQTFWRLSQEKDFFNIDFTRRAHMMQLLTMLPDSFIGGCAKWMIKLISSSGTEMNPAGTCRHCNAIIGLNNFICPACSCSYPFIDLSNIEQREHITRSVRMLWQEIPNDSGTIVGFGHPHRVPPNNNVLQIKSLTRMQRRLHQPKSYLTFNGHDPGLHMPKCFNSTRIGTGQ